MKRIEATFFRQTMFASFEKDVHEMARIRQGFDGEKHHRDLPEKP